MRIAFFSRGSVRWTPRLVADVALTGRLTTDPPVRDPTTAGPMLDGLLAANAAFAAGWWRIPS